MVSLPFLASLNEFTLFILVLGRLAGILSAIPLFGGERVPMNIRAMTVLALTMVCYPMLKLQGVTIPSDTLSVFFLVLAEALIGITLGLIVKALFDAVEFCGQIVGMNMGFSMSSLFDPTMGQVPLMALFQTMVAMLLFLTLGVHHLFISAMIESYRVIPVGGWHVSGELITFIITATTGIFVLGVKLAAPVMVALLATAIVLGVMARSFPQMNIFVISMPLNIAVGFLVLGFSLVVFMHTLTNSFGGLPGQISGLFRLLGG